MLHQKAKYEATCILQKTRLDVREKGLSARKEAAVAMAELTVFEVEEADDAASHASPDASEIERTKYKLTEKYVKKQNDILNSDKDKQYDVIPSAVEHVKPKLSSFAVEFTPHQIPNEPTNVPLTDIAIPKANFV